MGNCYYKFLAIFPLLLILSCQSNQEPQRHFTQKESQIAEKLLQKNGKKLLLQKIVNYHDAYYFAVENDLRDLHKTLISNLKNRDLNQVRKLAQKNMRSDAALMDKVKSYTRKSLTGIKDNESTIRFAYNRNPLILEKAANFLSDDDYFNAIISGKIFADFKWQKMTFNGGIENYDKKGTVAISALAASLIYLLDDCARAKNLQNHSAIIYNESIAFDLSKNPQLLKKLQKNYHLFSGADMVAKIYEGYEFGGNKNLQPINNPKFLPQDCATAIATLLSIKHEQFSTYHLASYYDEFFKENAVYWKFSDWVIRDKIIKKLKPVKFAKVTKIKPGTILAFRFLKDENSLKDPKNYIGKEGHVAVILGIDGDDLYYISFERDLEETNKNGVGIDVMSVKETEELIAKNKLAFFTFEAKPVP